MKKSTYTTLLLPVLLFSLPYQAVEMKKEEKRDAPFHLSVKPTPLDRLPYGQWPKDREITYSNFYPEKQVFEGGMNTQDQRKKIDKLYLKIRSYEESVDITKYIVKLHSYYGSIFDKEISGEGTATIIQIKEGIIYLLTCAHNVIRYIDLDGGFNPNGTESSFSAQSISFSYQGQTYPCTSYYVYPHYCSKKDQNKDIAIIVSHRGYELNFPYPIFPETMLASASHYKGYIIGYPGEKRKKGELYGMAGALKVIGDFCNYECIDTSKGQSGSAIWAEVDGIYKIIGVHTLTGTMYYNSGVSLKKEMIDWERNCWFEAKKVYHRHAKIFDLPPDVEEIVADPNFDLNMKEKSCQTPFLCAAKKGNLSALKLLKEKGANVKLTDQYGNNALHLASLCSPKGKVTEWLIDIAHLSIESKGRFQRTPFLCAAEKGNLTVLKLLKQKGAKVQVTDEDGHNALHLASTLAPKGKGIDWLIDTAQIPIESKENYQRTPFLCAAEKGNLPVLKLLTKKGVNVNATDAYGDNALHLASLCSPEGKVIEWLIDTAHLSIESKGRFLRTPFLCAAKAGNLPALKLLKKKGANVNATKYDGENALHLAILCNSKFEITRWLVNVAQVNIDAQGKYQRTPLFCAASRGNLPTLQLLKQKGANVKATLKDGKNSLHLAARYAPEGKGIEWLIDTAQIPIESKAHSQETPFLCAAKKGNLPALKLLKRKGCNTEATDQDGHNALHLAALFSPEGQGIEWLIDTAQIPIESKAYSQATPFFCAAKTGNLPALQLLKQKGCNIESTDQNGHNALHLGALFSPEGQGIEWFIDTAHLSIESKGRFQRTPFLHAAEKGNLSVLKLLKQKGANVKATDQGGHNALHLAALFSPEGKVIEWLIDTAQIPIESKGYSQDTAFLCAAKKSNLPVLKLLKQKGANIKATDQDGHNALHLAALFSPEGKVIEWLIDTAQIPIESKGNFQRTTFLYAAEAGNLPALKLLKEKGANIKATDQYGNNALHLAALCLVEGKVVEWLVDTANINIESKGLYQKTGFLCAAAKSNLPALKLLKEKGANIKTTCEDGSNTLDFANFLASQGERIKWRIDTAQIPIESKNRFQKTPFLCAAEAGNLPVLKLLKEKGANVKVSDWLGKNALHLAAQFAPDGKGIEWLIDTAQIPIESKGYKDSPPFLCAALGGNLPALKLLKEKGANVKVTDQEGNNAIVYATSLTTIAWLQKECGIQQSRYW